MSLLNLFGTMFITSCSLVALTPFAGRVGLLDVPVPGSRKCHGVPTPLVGGLGIWLGIVVTSFLLPSVLASYDELLLISTLVLFIGMLDDVRELGAGVRILAHCVAVGLMIVVADNAILSLGDLLFSGPIELGILAAPVTVVATVGVINAVNMTDGVDGLSGGLVVICLFFLGVVSALGGDLPLLQFTTIVLCAVLAFLFLNFRLPWKQSALVYLGDAGSTLLGFMLVWLFIEATQGHEALMSPVIALWFLAIPLMDTVRLLRRSPSCAGTDHLHHRLLAAGYSQGQIVFGLYFAAFAMGAVGLAGHLLGVPEGVMFLLFISLFAAYMRWH